MYRKSNNHINLAQRISQLEGRLDKDEQSIAKRASMWVGLIALIFSITIGLFQLYEFTVIKK